MGAHREGIVRINAPMDAVRGKKQCAIRGNFCSIDKPALSNNEFGITGHSEFCLPAPELLFLEFHGDEPCVPAWER